MSKKYKPANPGEHPRFCGPRTFFRLPYEKNLTDVDFVVVGVPFDTGSVLRVGARFAPQAIREASKTFRNYNPAHKINIFEHLSGVDFGDLTVVPGFVEKSYEIIVPQLDEIYDRDVLPFVVGGDHSVSYATLKSCSKKNGPLALIHFDSHSDTWDNFFETKYNHATQFRRAVEEGFVDPENSIQVGLRGSISVPEEFDDIKKLGYEFLTTSEIKKIGLEKTAEIIKKRIAGKTAFLSFDIDFIDPAFAPACSFPECGGFTSFETIELVRMLKDVKFAGFDIVELIPAYDSAEITAILASTVLYELISLYAVQKRDARVLL